MRILVKNAVKRKKGYLYSIDSEGNIIESKGLNIVAQGVDSTLRKESSTIKKNSPRVHSTLRDNTTKTKTINKPRLSSLQKSILYSLSYKYEHDLRFIVSLFDGYSKNSVYRSIDNLIKKGLVIKSGRKSYLDRVRIKRIKERC